MSVNRDFQESDQTLQGGAITERDVNNVENMDSHSNVTGIMSTPQTPTGYIVGMGRGEQLACMIEHRARSSTMSPLEIHRPADGIHTPSQDQPQDLRQSLVDLVKQLGSEIGAQVASSLANPSNQASDAAFPPPQSSTTMQHHDWSKVNLILKPEIKEPPFFRGDGSDRCTVTEWQEMMQLYLTKKGCSVSERGAEIMDRLLGRAKDIVRIGIRNSPLVNISRDPDVIYDILRQHFGESISTTTPLADFYSTLPRQLESSLDYWIRLNKTIDLANECLQRQGKRVEDPGHEAAMMFVKHCPEPALYAAFRSKPVEKWTVGEVQEMVDSYHRDKLSTKSSRAQHIAKVEEGEISGAWCMPQQSAFPVPIASNSEHATMNRVVFLLEKLLSTQEKSRGRGNSRPSTSAIPNDSPCKVCNEQSHTTQSHCFRDGLCFSCHKPGHRGFECPERKPGTARQPTSSGPSHNLN